MILTQKLLERFQGGQVEIKNPGDDCVHAGTVKEIYIEDGDELHIVFASFTSGNCDLQFPMWWEDQERLHCAAVLELFRVENKGRDPGKIECGSNLALKAILDGHGQEIVLRPPRVHRIEPVQAKGSQFARA